MKTKWTPKFADTYYYVSVSTGEDYSVSTEHQDKVNNRKWYNAFKTREECKEFEEWVWNKLDGGEFYKQWKKEEEMAGKKKFPMSLVQTGGKWGPTMEIGIKIAITSLLIVAFSTIINALVQ